MIYWRHFRITTRFYEADGDDPAGYVATNDELGLVVEADTMSALQARVRKVAPELFELNALQNLHRPGH